MRFFDRFRGALSRYAAGVHDLGAPASEKEVAELERALAVTLPAAYRDFLSQWNGGWLFHDDYALFGTAGAHPELARLARDGARVRVGAGPAEELLLDGEGRVIARDLDTEEERVVGSDFERWLEATLAREAVLYDRDGEFRQDAFDGGELAEAARRKRAQVALKADPRSPAWHAELGEILAEEGDAPRAIDALSRAVELDPELAPAHLALGRLRRETGDARAAAEAFARAAAAERDPEEAAFAHASAARAFVEAGVPHAAAHAARVIALDPSFVDQQRAGAAHLVDEGDLEGALERLSLAAAVRPDDAELRAELARLRARRALKPI